MGFFVLFGVVHIHTFAVQVSMYVCRLIILFDLILKKILRDIFRTIVMPTKTTSKLALFKRSYYFCCKIGYLVGWLWLNPFLLGSYSVRGRYTVIYKFRNCANMGHISESIDIYARKITDSELCNPTHTG